MPVQRRTTKYAPPAGTAKSQPVAPKSAANHTPVTQPKKENSLPSRKGSASETSTPGQSASQSAPTVGTLKRSDSKSGAKKDKTAGDIFKSFAKAKAKPKEDKPKESTPAPVEDGMLSCHSLLTWPASDFYRTHARHVRG
jgi:DNA polymerase delta subunit 3